MTMITSPKTSAMPTVPSAVSYSALATTAPAPANTNAKAAKPSARTRRARSGRGTVFRLGHEVREQRLDAFRELVADAADRLDVLAGGVLDVPVLVALAGIDRAGVPTAHRDHRVGGADELVGHRLRELLGDIESHLIHRLDHRRVDPVGGLAACGANVDVAGGVVVE